MIIGQIKVDPERIVWLREEYQEKWGELITRADACEILGGISSDSLASRRSKYADIFPPYAAKYGQNSFLVRSEVEKFARDLEEIRQNGGRSPLDQARSDLVHCEQKRKTILSRIDQIKAALRDLEYLLQIEDEQKLMFEDRIKVLSQDQS